MCGLGFLTSETSLECLITDASMKFLTHSMNMKKMENFIFYSINESASMPCLWAKNNDSSNWTCESLLPTVSDSEVDDLGRLEQLRWSSIRVLSECIQQVLCPHEDLGLVQTCFWQGQVTFNRIYRHSHPIKILNYHFCCLTNNIRWTYAPFLNLKIP